MQALVKTFTTARLKVIHFLQLLPDWSPPLQRSTARTQLSASNAYGVAQVRVVRLGLVRAGKSHLIHLVAPTSGRFFVGRIPGYIDSAIIQALIRVWSSPADTHRFQRG